MRQWLRSHLTYANVMVTILAFLVLGGGTALAAYVVTSNSQIGPGTVSGHTPPSGKHPNIIAGSINGGDVADNSLRGSDIIEPSLTGNAHKLIYNYYGGPTREKIGTVGPYTLKASCGPGSPAWSDMGLWVHGPAGVANFTFIESSGDGGPFDSGTVRIPANKDKRVTLWLAANPGQPPPDPGQINHVGGTMMLRSGSVLGQVDLNGAVDATGTFRNPCFLSGTATLGG